MIRILILQVFLLQAALMHINGQVFPPQDVIGGDTCIFDIPCESIKIDTSQSNNLWQIGKPSKTVLNNAFIGTRAIITDSINAYDTNNISSFTLQLVHPNTLYHEIIFWHKYDTDTGKDGGYIEMSYDMGVTWTDILDNWSYPLGFQLVGGLIYYNSEDTIHGGRVGFSGSSNGWIKTVLTWGIPYEGAIIDDKVNRDTTLLRFTFISDSIPDNKDGWCIDNMVQLYYTHYELVNSTDSEHQTKVFPNPCRDFFSYESPLPPTRIIIYNSLGTLVALYDNPGKTLNISELPQGLYYAAFYTNNKVLSVEKLLITL